MGKIRNIRILREIKNLISSTYLLHYALIQNDYPVR